ncbi:MAG: hypothetical protein RL497_2849 [Pseudomonadota bacterium]|jgi:hypothetical protein
MKIICTLLISGCVALSVHAQEKYTYRPLEGYVPDAKTASLIAEAVLKPIYGNEKINREKPFSVTLDGEIWKIKGTLKSGLKGGVAEIEISKVDGTILRLAHGK